MIRVRDEGGLRLLVLDRADKANALTALMLADLAGAVEGADGFAALVITGAGTVFSAGADLAGMAEGLGDAPEWGRLAAALDGFRGVSVAALNGTLAGGAFGMALACDLRVCVPGAEFFYPVMKRGYLPQRDDPKRLAALVGPSRARMILLAGARIGAAEALHWGLVDRVEADVMAAARVLCADALAAGAHGARIKALF